MQTILFATDFSTLSSRAEEYAAELASATGARVTILHAIEPMKGVEGEEDDDLDAFYDRLRARAEAEVAEVTQRFKEAGVDCSAHLTVGQRWQEICRVAEEENVDLIVLGSHAVREGEKIYIGTTSHKVFFATTVPLLVVRQETG